MDPSMDAIKLLLTGKPVCSISLRICGGVLFSEWDAHLLLSFLIIHSLILMDISGIPEKLQCSWSKLDLMYSAE